MDYGEQEESLYAVRSFHHFDYPLFLFYIHLGSVFPWISQIHWQLLLLPQAKGGWCVLSLHRILAINYSRKQWITAYLPKLFDYVCLLAHCFKHKHTRFILSTMFCNFIHWNCGWLTTCKNKPEFTTKERKYWCFHPCLTLILILNNIVPYLSLLKE